MKKELWNFLVDKIFDFSSFDLEISDNGPVRFNGSKLQIWWNKSDNVSLNLVFVGFGFLIGNSSEISEAKKQEYLNLLGDLTMIVSAGKTFIDFN